MGEDEVRIDDEGWPTWTKWAAAIFLLLAYCNYAEKDETPASPYATAGMSSRQVIAYRDCLKRYSYGNLSDHAQSEMCRRSALDLNGDESCGTDWDGRSNPTSCE